MKHIHAYSWFMTAEPIQVLDEAALHKAEQIFLDYQSRDVILPGCSFADSKWELTDEKNVVRFSFNVDRDAYAVNASAWACCDADTYVKAVKTYAAMHLGTRILPTIQSEIRILCSLPNKPLQAIKASWEHAGSIVEFLHLLPDDSLERDSLADAFERAMGLYPQSNQRKLAPFRDFIRFNDAMSAFWKQADTMTKILYFPIFLWWNLSGILPIRPTEFLLIPRQCLSQIKGKYILTIRRTNLKKGLLRVFYSIELDYKKVSYEIPQHLAEEILFYLDNTKGMPPPSVDSLFIPIANQSYFSYKAANSLLHSFVDTTLGDGTSIHLGDTRHLSMISLILSGNSAEMCKRLADQENVMVAANYFSNLGSVLQSYVMELISLKNGVFTLNGNHEYHITAPLNVVKVKNGYCDSQQVREGLFYDCAASYSLEMGIGACTACAHFHPDAPGIHVDMQNRVSEILGQDIRYLVHTLDKIRAGSGKKETLDEILTKLRSDITFYSHFNINA